MIFRKLLDWAISLLPHYDISDGMKEHIITASQWTQFANHYLPMTTFLACIAVYLAAWIICVIISAILKLL